MQGINNYKKKKIASTVNDIIFSEIDLKENTLNNNDVGNKKRRHD